MFVNSARVIGVEGETPEADQVESTQVNDKLKDYQGDSAKADDELVEGLSKLSLAETQSTNEVVEEVGRSPEEEAEWKVDQERRQALMEAIRDRIASKRRLRERRQAFLEAI